MNLSWEDVRLFLAVAEVGSMSGAARKLRIGQPTVSRRLADLEHQLGYALFERKVEGTVLTSRGQDLLTPATRMAEWAAEVEQSAARGASAPSGPVRITAPPGVAFDFLAPFAAHLRDKQPQIRLEVIASIGYLDLARREADLALRMRRVSHKDLMTIATLRHKNAAFASRSYAQRLASQGGKKLSIGDIDWIAWAPPLDQLSPNPELAAAIEGFQPAFASDDFLVQLRAAEAGVGAMFLGDVGHRFMAPDSSRLVKLPLSLPPVETELHLVCAKSAWLVPRIRLVAEAITEELSFAKLPDA